MAEEEKEQAKPREARKHAPLQQRLRGRFEIRFLEQARQNNTMLEFDFSDGRKLFGQVLWHDEFTIGIRCPDTKEGSSPKDEPGFKEVLLYKHTIVSIKPVN